MPGLLSPDLPSLLPVTFLVDIFVILYADTILSF